MHLVQSMAYVNGTPWHGLANHPWTMTHASLPEDNRLARGITPALAAI